MGGKKERKGDAAMVAKLIIGKWYALRYDSAMETEAKPTYCESDVIAGPAEIADQACDMVPASNAGCCVILRWRRRGWGGA